MPVKIGVIADSKEIKKIKLNYKTTNHIGLLLIS